MLLLNNPFEVKTESLEAQRKLLHCNKFELGGAEYQAYNLFQLKEDSSQRQV